jgi:hypothetical protein
LTAVTSLWQAVLTLTKEADLTDVVKVRLSRQQLKDELKLPSAAEIVAAMVNETVLVLWVKHPQAPKRGDETEATFEVKLSDIRTWGEY